MLWMCWFLWDYWKESVISSWSKDSSCNLQSRMLIKGGRGKVFIYLFRKERINYAIRTEKIALSLLTKGKADYRKKENVRANQVKDIKPEGFGWQK